MANLERIANVQISLNTGGISAEGFSTMLVVGTSTLTKNRVETYTSIDELTEAGYKDTDPIYIACASAFSQTPAPAVVKVGRRAESTEPLADTMAAIMAEDSDWYGWILASTAPEDILAAAKWTEAHRKLLGIQSADTEIIDAGNTSDIFTQLQTLNYFRTYGFYHANAETENLAAAIMARCFSINPGGETWALKPLAGISTDGLTETQYNTIVKKGGNTFERFRNRAVTQNGKVFGDEWIDVIRFRDWLAEEITVNVFNCLVNNDKVPYTDAGIALIENQIIAALKLGQARGGIAPDEYDEDGNRNQGWTVTVPRAASISANQKASRKLDDVKFTARLAGAIHQITIRGSLTYANLIAGGTTAVTV